MGFFTDKIYYHHYAHRLFMALFLLAFSGQVFFWFKTQSYRPAVEIVPQAPSKSIVEVSSFGDKEFLFRVLATRMQNIGDVFAGFVSLKKYDYNRLYDWMIVLDQLNADSRLVPSLASYYYANTDKEQDLRLIVKYLDLHASVDVDKHWWWLFQATEIARKNLKDYDLAMTIANKLAQNNAEDAPLWTKQMPAFVSKDKGDDCLAFQVISKILKESQDNTRQIKPEEMNFMRYFIAGRLKSMKQKNFDPRQCMNKS